MSQSASAITPDNAGDAIVCPECGRSNNDRSNPKIPSLFHWRRTTPIIILMLALASLGVWLKTGSQTFRSGSGSLYPRLVEPGISRADLQAIADGERTDIALTQAVVEASTRRWGGSLPGEPQLDVGFVAPRGTRTIRDSVGWPLAWFTTTEHHNYENPITREGLLLVRISSMSVTC